MQKKVFVDCGSNIGESINKFLKYFDHKNNYFIYAFEPNKKLTNKYKFKNIEILNKIVWVKNGVLNFSIGKKINSTNSRLLQFKKNKKKFYDEEVCLPSIDFSQWITKNLKIQDYNILKMDIEYSEYEVLSKIIQDKNHIYFKEIYIEFHDANKYEKQIIYFLDFFKLNKIIVKSNFRGSKEFKDLYKSRLDVFKYYYNIIISKLNFKKN